MPSKSEDEEDFYIHDFDEHGNEESEGLVKAFSFLDKVPEDLSIKQRTAQLNRPLMNCASRDLHQKM